MDGLGLAPGLFRWVVVAIVVGFPVALVVGWVFDFREGRLRRTSSSDRAAPRASTRRFLTGVVAAVVLGVVLWWLEPLPARGNVVAGADVVAVLPFRASGPGSEGLDEGMVDLLSANLDEVGDVRTVDPARVLAARERRGGARPLAREDALELGRDVGASSVLRGSLSMAGGSARLASELLATADGSELSAVEVEGPADEVFRLVDSLSVEILRDVWRSDAPLPNLDVSAITTADPAALRAYLRGEAYRRRARWDSAETALRQAVAADSTFALAASTLSSVLGWTRPTSTAELERLRELALRHRDRLPEGARRTAWANHLWQTGRLVEARDSLLALLAEDPDDPRAWSLLGEVRYHGQLTGVLRQPTDSIHRAFQRALEVVPQDATALLHPLGLSLRNREEELFRRYLDRFREVAGPETVDAVASAGASLFDGGPGAARALLDLAGTRTGLERELLSGLLRHPERDVVELGDSARALLEGPSRGPWSLGAVATLLLSTGRGKDARPFLERLTRTAPRLSAGVWATAFSLGMLPPAAPADSLLPPGMTMMPGAAGVRHFMAAFNGFWRGEAGPIRELLKLADTGVLTAPQRRVLPAVRALEGIARGDTTRNLPALRSAVREQLARSGDPDVLPGELLLLPLLRIEAARPTRAPAALSRLRGHAWFTPIFAAPAMLTEAEALRTMGRGEEARARARRVLEILREADEGVPARDLALELLEE